MQINDCILNALGGGHINDKLLEYYQANGATSNDMDDAEYEFLLVQGATPGLINDMWYEFLLSQGLTGSVTDMKHQYWCISNGTIINYVDYIEMRVSGSLSSYTRGGSFGLYDYNDVLYEFNVDFIHKGNRESIAYNQLNTDLFLKGTNQTASIVAANATGYIDITGLKTLNNIKELTISGRTDAGSTKFGFKLYDKQKVLLKDVPLAVVQSKIIIPIGIDLR